MNDDESAAMWELYSSGGKAIAITSSYDRLRRALPEHCYSGAVNYIDYTTDMIPEDRVYTPFFFKRKSFAHENELRLLCTDFLAEGRVVSSGVYVPVDLRSVITDVYVSPKSPTWYLEVVTAVIAKFGLKLPVNQSALDAAAVF